MSSIQFSPPGYYEVKGQIYKLKTAYLAAIVAANQSIIAAVPDYYHRIMGWDIFAQGGGATGGQFDVGGASAYGWILPAGNKIQREVHDSGYFECATNQALLADVNTTGCDINVFYLTIKA